LILELVDVLRKFRRCRFGFHLNERTFTGTWQLKVEIERLLGLSHDTQPTPSAVGKHNDDRLRHRLSTSGGKRLNWNQCFKSQGKMESQIRGTWNMARGGARPGSGRKKGAANKATAEARKAALASGISPLDFMLSVMRDETADVRRRDAMAMAAAPYLHPRLAPVEHGGNDGRPVQTVMRVEFVRAKDGRPAPPDDLPDDLPADLPANVARLPLAN
jgi:hypothetical protein